MEINTKEVLLKDNFIMKGSLNIILEIFTKVNFDLENEKAKEDLS